ncbi:uncharacterized protein LOC124358017 [Homalodisca vitripennis]|uniref:uncharacterized protein LOC124358017 n=1 Tax=Homalodisca vitripennis TaxID=197043 RepID=UPI001EEB9648|nr:uncharacterized protein LOC124358017 [Homalodisca vitripennis]
MERHCCASRSPSLESVHVDSHCHSHKHKGQTKVKSSKCSKHGVTHVGGLAQVSESCNHQLGHLGETLGHVEVINSPIVVQKGGTHSPPLGHVATIVGPKLEQEEKTCGPTLSKLEAPIGAHLVQGKPEHDDNPVETETKCEALVKDNTPSIEDDVNLQERICDVAVSQEN